MVLGGTWVLQGTAGLGVIWGTLGVLWSTLEYF